MKKYFVIFAILPCPVMGMTDRVRLDMLESQILTLEKQRVKKYTELKKCESETKNFKIAGISTLAATGVGIYANIALHNKLSKLRNSTAGGATTVVRSAAQAQAQDNELCEIDPTLCA